MNEKKSFTKIEHELSSKLKEILNKAEDLTDISNGFAQICAELLKNALNIQPVANNDFDIDFTNGKYKIAKSIYENPVFQEALQSSDLESILLRFLEESLHRGTHLKHSDKRIKKDQNNSSKAF